MNTQYTHIHARVRTGKFIKIKMIKEKYLKEKYS